MAEEWPLAAWKVRNSSHLHAHIPLQVSKKRDFDRVYNSRHPEELDHAPFRGTGKLLQSGELTNPIAPRCL